MAKEQSKGKCTLCQVDFNKGNMSRHLKACVEGRLAAAKSRKSSPVFHIAIGDRYRGAYWLHVDALDTASLEDLDEFLREIWVECCGHLSEFRIGKTSYNKPFFNDDPFGLPSRDMDVPLGDVLKPGVKFTYSYDFGSTTELVLRVESFREGLATRKDKIFLLARNNAPEITCLSCGKPATEVCTECGWEDGGWYCRKCLRKHPCGDEMALPVVNSPRVGVCGYTGEG
jgi:hypothetical protein